MTHLIFFAMLLVLTPQIQVNLPSYARLGVLQSQSVQLGSSSKWHSVGGTTEGYNQGGFYAQGRYWTWYSDGTWEHIKSSPDGVSWVDCCGGKVSKSGSATPSADFSAVTDGTYIYYVHSAVGDEWYRRGLLNGDGSISWSTSSDISLDANGAPCIPGSQSGQYTQCDQPAIALDGTGHVWVGFVQPQNDCGGCAGGWPWVMRNLDNTDGGWQTDASLGASKLSSYKTNPGQGDAEWAIMMVQVPSGMYFLYGHGGRLPSDLIPFYGRLWTQSGGMGPQAVVSTGAMYGDGNAFSAVAVNGEIYLAYIDGTLNKTSGRDYGAPIASLRFATGTPGGSWSDTIIKETTSNGWPDNTNPPEWWPPWSIATSVDASGNIYVFWTGLPSSMGSIPINTCPSMSGKFNDYPPNCGWYWTQGPFSIYYMEYSSGTWGSPVEWLTDNTGFRSCGGTLSACNNYPTRQNLMVYPTQGAGSGIGITYEEGGCVSTATSSSTCDGVWTPYFTLFGGGGTTISTTTLSTTQRTTPSTTPTTTSTVYQSGIISTLATASTVTTTTASTSVASPIVEVLQHLWCSILQFFHASASC